LAGIGPDALIIINRWCGNIVIIEQAASNCSDIRMLRAVSLLSLAARRV
jgi:hypothetical protein